MHRCMRRSLCFVHHQAQVWDSAHVRMRLTQNNGLMTSFDMTTASVSVYLCTLTDWSIMRHVIQDNASPATGKQRSRPLQRKKTVSYFSCESKWILEFVVQIYHCLICSSCTALLSLSWLWPGMYLALLCMNLWMKEILQWRTPRISWLTPCCFLQVRISPYYFFLFLFIA